MADDFLNGRPVGSYFVFDEPKEITLDEWYEKYGFYDAVCIGEVTDVPITVVAYAETGLPNDELGAAYRDKFFEPNSKYFRVAGYPQWFKERDVVFDLFWRMI